MPISDELKRIYVTAPIDDYYIETLALEHPLFPDTGQGAGVRYITNNRDGWTGDLETGGTATYTYLPFASIPPNGAEQAALTLQVQIDNTSRELMDELELLSTSPTDPIFITYRVYLQSDTAVQNDPPLRLEILSVVAKLTSIAFTAGMTNLRSRPFPAMLYTTSLYPGLER